MPRHMALNTRLHLVPVFVESLEEDFRHAIVNHSGSKPESKEQCLHYVVGNLRRVAE
jgi:hypothetical protein